MYEPSRSGRLIKVQQSHFPFMGLWPPTDVRMNLPKEVPNKVMIMGNRTTLTRCNSSKQRSIKFLKVMNWMFYLPDKLETWWCSSNLYFHILLCIFSVMLLTPSMPKLLLLSITSTRILGGSACFLKLIPIMFFENVLILTVYRQSGVSQPSTQWRELSWPHEHRGKAWWYRGGAGCHSQFILKHLIGNQIAGDIWERKSALLRNIRGPGGQAKLNKAELLAKLCKRYYTSHLYDDPWGKNLHLCTKILQVPESKWYGGVNIKQR